jgi:hypothetical protein
MTSTPCFFFARCEAAAQVEKQGKALCERCSLGVKGQVYPLRDHTWRSQEARHDYKKQDE